MNVRKFKLESLLSYRSFLKSEAAARLGQAARARLEAYESLATCEAELAEMERLLDPSATEATRAADLLMIQKGIAEQRRQIAHAARVYNQAVDAEESSREEVLTAQKDYEALLNLQNRQKEEQRVEELRIEERVMEEYTNVRFKSAAKA